MNSAPLRWWLGAFGIFLSSLMLVSPLQGTLSPLYQSIGPYISLLGVLTLTCSVLFVAVPVFAERRGMLALAHLAGLTGAGALAAVSLISGGASLALTSAVTLSIAWSGVQAWRRVPDDVNAPDLLVLVVAAAGVLAGLILLIYPVALEAPVYAVLRLYATPLGALFLGSGLVAVGVELRRAEPLLRWIGIIPLGLSLLTYCLLVGVAFHVWSAVLFQAPLCLAFLAWPLVTRFLTGLDRHSLQVRLPLSMALLATLLVVATAAITGQQHRDQLSSIAREDASADALSLGQAIAARTEAIRSTDLNSSVPAAMAEAVARTQIPRDVAVWVVGPKGERLSAAGANATLPDSPPDIAALAQPGRAAVSTVYKGPDGEHYVGIARIGDLGWFIAVDRSSSLLFAGQRNADNRAFGIIVAFIILAGCIGVIAANVLARPLRTLMAAVEALGHDSASLPSMHSRITEVNHFLSVLRRTREELAASQARLKEEALRDPLTNLYNRRYLTEFLERELARVKRRGLPLSLVMLDLDHFKEHNDRFGHQAGDELLCRLGDLLRAGIREEDAVCRYGGEEFLVVLPESPSAPSLQRAEQLRRAIEARLSTLNAPVSASCGVATYPQDGDNVHTIIAAADRALYQAKIDGRNQVRAAQ